MRIKISRSLLLLCSFCAAGAGTGCFTGEPKQAELLKSAQLVNSDPALSRALPAPTKDEVALVDGRPLSLTAFLALKSSLKNQSNEGTFWIGTAALAIQNMTRSKGLELDVGAAVQIARYALGDLTAAEADRSLAQYFQHSGLPPTSAQVRLELDRLLSLAIVRRNQRIMSILNQS